MSSSWFVYILRCADKSLYTGITIDVEKRLQEHNADNVKGAKYTRARRPVELVYQETLPDRSGAAKREAQIKKLSRQQKIKLINADESMCM
ncbi:GIY-YIG nuclease family protein [Thalassotalea mangrovi]|uniref:GIY-YIG nuclease family protein n=1 Tax=Thalassotalea mangrovi TaxID=2572245 RepID=A0A4U1BAX5_9GAMM|nr:GIY-YIG nuclease family protein [Thalassotalea mangrovi]TKB47695.1 GIY-YIG nuclease family protein [Thalassotalea mangrovi]